MTRERGGKETGDKRGWKCNPNQQNQEIRFPGVYVCVSFFMVAPIGFYFPNNKENDYARARSLALLF